MGVGQGFIADFNHQGVWYICRLSQGHGKQTITTNEKDTQTGTPDLDCGHSVPSFNPTCKLSLNPEGDSETGHKTTCNFVVSGAKVQKTKIDAEKAHKLHPRNQCNRVCEHKLRCTCCHQRQPPCTTCSDNFVKPVAHCHTGCSTRTSCSNKMEDCDSDSISDVMILELSELNEDSSKPLNSSEMGSPGGESTDQLAIVEEMVLEMKAGFVTVLEELSKIQYDEKKQQEWLKKANGYESQIKALTGTVDTLKEELRQMSDQMKSYGEEKDILLMELQRNGQLSTYCREKLNLKTEEATTPQSDFDSGVNLPQQSTGWGEGNTSPPGLAPMVKPFMESLNTGNDGKSGDDHYDSDSVSVTALANRSLQLSETLRAKYQEMSSQESSNEGEEQNSSFEETLLSGKKLNGDLRHQGGSNEENQLHDQAFNEKQRQRLTMEILSSERKYCSTLWTLIDDYISPLRQMNLVSSQELNMMFPSYLTQMYAQHCSILRKLEDRVLNWRWNGVVGDIFAKLTDTQENDLLSLYRDYVSDFPNALNKMNKWKQQSFKFNSFLKNHHHGRGSQGTDVTALLLAPVQRVAQYVLLIKELLQYTDHNHSDRYYLVASLAILRNFLNQLNEEIQHAVQLVEDGPLTRRSSHSAQSGKSSGSSCDINHAMSARDSGIHSTGEELVKMHQSPPPRHIVSRRNRQDDQKLTDRSAPESYSRRLRLVASHSNINRVLPSGGAIRPESPYNMVDVNGHSRARDRQRRTQGRRTLDSFPAVQQLLAHRTASPASRHSAVPRLQLDEFFDPVLDASETRSYRESSLHQRPRSVVGRSCMYDDFEMDRLSQLAQNRPHSTAEHLLLQEEIFHTDAEAQLQQMLELQSNSSRKKSSYRTRERLSMTPDEEFYGHRAHSRSRDIKKLAGIDHLIESGLLMRAQSPHEALREERQFSQDYGIYGDHDDIDDEPSGPTSLPSVSSNNNQDLIDHQRMLLKSKSHSAVPLAMNSIQNLDTPTREVSCSGNNNSKSTAYNSNVTESRKDDASEYRARQQIPVEEPIANGRLHQQQQHISTKRLLELQSQGEGHLQVQGQTLNKAEPTISASCEILNDIEGIPVTSVPPVTSMLPRPDSRLSNGTPGKTPKKKNRDRAAKIGFTTALSKSVDDVSKAKKKNSIRDSLKNIFNKKRWTINSSENEQNPETHLISNPEPPQSYLPLDLVAPFKFEMGSQEPQWSTEEDPAAQETISQNEEQQAPLASPEPDSPVFSLPRKTSGLRPVGLIPLPRQIPPKKPPRARRPATLTGTFRDARGEPFSPV